MPPRHPMPTMLATAIAAGSLPRSTANRGGPNPLFTDTLIGLPGVAHSALAWGDYDKDGDLAAGDFPEGVSRVVWDGRDGSGDPLPPGVYIVRLTTASRAESFKTLLVR